MSQNGWVNWHSVFIVSDCCKLYDFLPFFPKFDQKIEIRHERRNSSSDVTAASIDIARIKPQFSNLIYQKQQIKLSKRYCASIYHVQFTVLRWCIKIFTWSTKEQAATFRASLKNKDRPIKWTAYLTLLFCLPWYCGRLRQSITRCRKWYNLLPFSPLIRSDVDVPRIKSHFSWPTYLPIETNTTPTYQKN